MSNSNFSRAKNSKNDEYYTRLGDVETELRHYEPQFREKVICCNCNDGEKSAFWQYFSENFERLHLKRVTAVTYGDNAYRLDMTKEGIYKTTLADNGDFRSAESIEILKTADMVITNPPFSLFREYLEMLLKYGKKFLIVGSINMAVCKDIFPYFKNDMLRFGYSPVKRFIREDGGYKSFGNVRWFTNLDRSGDAGSFQMNKSILAKNYPVYDNYPAIDVGRVSDIPCDYYGIMGVPLSYLEKHDPEKFTIIGLTQGNDGEAKVYIDPIQHRPDGTLSYGTKVNTSAVIRVDSLPDGIYYTANNADGYLVCKFIRVLIKRKAGISTTVR